MSTGTRSAQKHSLTSDEEFVLRKIYLWEISNRGPSVGLIHLFREFTPYKYTDETDRKQVCAAIESLMERQLVRNAFFMGVEELSLTDEGRVLAADI